MNETTYATALFRLVDHTPLWRQVLEQLAAAEKGGK